MPPAGHKTPRGGRHDQWGEVFVQMAHFYPGKDPELLDEKQIEIFLSGIPILLKLTRPVF